MTRDAVPAFARARWQELLLALLAWLESFPLAILQLLFRISIAAVFWNSGLTKLASWQTTIVLFRDEYKVPVLPPELAATLAASVELTCPVLLVLGLATRLATLPMLGMTFVIEAFIYPEDWIEHLTWASLLLFILTRGPGLVVEHRSVAGRAVGDEGAGLYGVCLSGTGVGVGGSSRTATGAFGGSLSGAGLNASDETLVFLLGSRYCETDKLADIAWRHFGSSPRGWRRVQAICDFVCGHLTFGYEHARATRTAFEAYHERIGVCRDFAHLAVSFCRCMNIPARYANGFLGDIGVPPDPAPMDYNAWFEAFLDGRWFTFDARHNTPRIGRITVARGRDATDIPLVTSFGPHILKTFWVWTDEVDAAALQDLNRRSA